MLDCQLAGVTGPETSALTREPRAKSTVTKKDACDGTLEADNARLRAELARTVAALRESNRELFQLQRRAVRAERQRLAQHMTARFAHKIGTPLNLLSGHLQLIQASRPGDEELQRKLRLLADQVDKLTASVQDVLDEARRPRREHAPVRLGSLIARIGELLMPALAATGVELRVEADPASVVLGDEVQLEQVFLTLFNNAIDAMSEGGVLTVRTTVDGDRVVSEVVDTGVGIDPECLPRVFDAFFTTKPAGRGTGLGLSIVREILAEHSGSISVESREGEGARFIIDLPAAQGSDAS